MRWGAFLSLDQVLLLPFTGVGRLCRSLGVIGWAAVSREGLVASPTLCAVGLLEVLVCSWTLSPPWLEKVWWWVLCWGQVLDVASWHDVLWWAESVCRLESNLVDSASSDTLSLRTKPCMCKYKKYSRLRMAHYISYSLFDSPLLLG